MLTIDRDGMIKNIVIMKGNAYYKYITIKGQLHFTKNLNTAAELKIQILSILNFANTCHQFLLDLEIERDLARYKNA